VTAIRVISREEIINAFRPLRETLETEIAAARALATLKAIAAKHPDVTRESHLQRIAGQVRWMLLADALVARVGLVDGFSVLSTDAQHNQGQYVFAFPGGIFTVKREPHDDSDPDDGRYLVMTLEGVLEQAGLAGNIDPADPIRVYLSVTERRAMLKVSHSTLSEGMKIELADLAEPIEPIVPSPAADRPRARARSTRVPSRDTGDSNAATDSPGVRHDG
jgi:hypothetical protein